LYKQQINKKNGGTHVNFKKAVAIATAAGALAAISVPAMAFENEFHGMYRAFGFATNAYYGGPGFNLKENSATDKYMEQRARLQYIAKASDDLKLVTHFELDTKFGGSNTAAKYPLGDAGNLDADRINLETKGVYLDFKIPAVPVRAQVGLQPYNDTFQGVFGNFDATGAVFNGNFGALKATYGYFTVGNSANTAAGSADLTFPGNARTKDLNVLDLKLALNKDLTVGASYYMVLNKPGSTQVTAGTPPAPVVGGAINNTGATLVNNTIGLNVAAKFGPADITSAFGYQFGKSNTGVNNVAGTTPGANTSATSFSLATKIAAGPGKVNLALLYLSGSKEATGYNHAWESIGTTVNYFTPANMWLLTRNAETINSSTAIGGGTDLTRGGLGIRGIFGGYDGTAGKVFYSGNVGYARVDQKRAAQSGVIGTELNASVGYKLYDNMSARFTAAYAILGDGYGKDTGNLLTNGTATVVGVAKADNPFLTAIVLNYAF
jgi:hypothetical protein